MQSNFFARSNLIWDRDAPSTEAVERIRQAIPTEPEMDRVLTNKMHRRSTGKMSMPTLTELEGYLATMVGDLTSGPVAVTKTRWMTGGASKIQAAATVTFRSPDGSERSVDTVIRMEPSESVNTTSRVRERQLIEAVAGILPVPEVYWVDSECRWFPQEAIVYELMRGVTKPPLAQGRLSGIGTNFGVRLRGVLGHQYVQHLARLHTLPVPVHGLSAFVIPAVGSTTIGQLELNRALRVWEEDRGFDIPVFDVAANWLQRNLPVLDHASIVHGDFRAGNFLFDPASEDITAWLDWERGYVGDRHRDLAWSTMSMFGHYAEDGQTFLVSGLLALDEFLAAYSDASGLSVDAETLRYYRILNALQLTASSLATGYRVARLGKSHQDVWIPWQEGFGYRAAEDLRRMLAEVI